MGSFLSETFFKSYSSKYCKEFTMYRKRKDIRKKTHQIFKLPNLCGVVFLWNFFISKEAATAERRYEKERHSVKLHACKLHLVQGQICYLFSMPSPSPPSHPPPINVIREASCIYFLPSPPPTHFPLLEISHFWRPRTKARTSSI